MRFILIFSLVLGLAACGKKPSSLEAPAQPDFSAWPADRERAKSNPDAKHKDDFPHTYPKPWL